jgi:hypothetical protein
MVVVRKTGFGIISLFSTLRKKIVGDIIFSLEEEDCLRGPKSKQQVAALFGPFVMMMIFPGRQSDQLIKHTEP